jgi:hypothetical protein
MEEMINRVVQEAIKYALDKYNYEIKIKNLDEIIEKIVPLSEKLLYKEDFDDVISSIIFNFLIRLSSDKIYFVEFMFEPYDDAYNYGLFLDSEIFEDLLLVRITLTKYGKYASLSQEEHEAKSKKLIEILEQHGFNKDQDDDEYFVHYNISFPLDVEVFRFLI